ncbi:MAG: hypothetical protein LKI24_05365 [Acidipropionibacterium sp.]|nr:hypothetical protein [Acidipropionibacterium sp.]
MNISPRAGHVFLVNDDQVNMPPEDHRTRHPQRTVLIISGDDYNYDGE